MEINSENVASKVAEEEKKLFLEIPKKENLTEKNSSNANTVVKKLPPDGGYGWVILSASFAISFILDGIMYSFGILLQAIKEYYDVSNSTANLLTSLYTGFFLLCGPLVSGLVNQFGCRVAIIGGALVTSLMFLVSIFSPNIYFMYASIGVIGGTATGVFYISSLIIIAEYFDKKKGMATGITMAGSGIGFFVGPHIIKKLIELYDWKITSVACAGMLFINSLIGILSKPLNPPKSQLKFSKKKKSEKEVVESHNIEIMSGSIVSVVSLKDTKESVIGGLFKEVTDFRLLRENWRFLCITLSNGFVFIGYFLPFIFLTEIAEKNGIEYPATIISVIGIVNIPGRLLFGLLADKRFLSPIMLNTLTVLLGTFPLLAYDMLLQKYLWSNCLFAILYALSTSGLVTLTTPYLCDIVGLERFGNAMGIVSLFRGFGCFSGPFIGGIIADNFSMAASFYFCGACYAFGFILSAIVSFSKPPKVVENENKC